MQVTDISFPKLNIYLKNVPKTFEIFGFEIALYGVIIAIGMLLAIMLAAYVAKKSGQNPDMYWDLAITALICGVLGARIYYVIFSWDSYKDNLWSIFNIRQGGLAIYGGIIGGFLAMAVFAKIKKQRYILMADTVVPAIALGQIIGRWGNFFNREVFGEYTDNLFAMRLPIDAVRQSDISVALASHIEEGTNYIQVHPTFLYEGMWNLMLLVLMLLLWRYKRFDGEVALLYFGGYGLGRFFIEGIRTDQLHIGNTGIAVSQLLGIVLFIAAVITEVVVLIKISKKNKKIVKQ